MSVLGKAADLAQRVVVVGLVAGTGFLAVTTVNQGRFLYTRRKALEAEVDAMLERGEITKEQVKDSSLRSGKGFTLPVVPKDGEPTASSGQTAASA